VHEQKTVKAFGFGIAHEMKSSYSACSLCLKGPSYIGGCKQTRAGVSTLSGDRGWLTRPTEPLWLSKPTEENGQRLPCAHLPWGIFSSLYKEPKLLYENKLQALLYPHRIITLGLTA